MKFLIAEILLCLLAASILGLIIGWLCKAAFAREKFNLREAEWQKKQRESDEKHQGLLFESQRNSEDLNHRLTSMGNQNQTLASSLEANKSAVHKAHIEVQQLNKKQKDSHERLQKIIAEKDREITKLQKETRQGKDSPPKPFGVSPAKPKPVHTPGKNAPSHIRSNVGGKPDTGNVNRPNAGFKPGTQANPQFNEPSDSAPKVPPGTKIRDHIKDADMDKTQVLKGSSTSAKTNYSDPLRDKNPPRENNNPSAAAATSAGSAKPSVANRSANTQSRVPQDSPTAKDSQGPEDFQTHRTTQGPGAQQNTGNTASSGNYDSTDSTYSNTHDQTLDSTVDSSGSFTQQATRNFEDTVSGSTADARNAVDDLTSSATPRKKSLWERVKSSVSKSVDKTKL